MTQDNTTQNSMKKDIHYPAIGTKCTIQYRKFRKLERANFAQVACVVTEYSKEYSSIIVTLNKTKRNKSGKLVTLDALNEYHIMEFEYVPRAQKWILVGDSPFDGAFLRFDIHKTRKYYPFCLTNSFEFKKAMGL